MPNDIKCECGREHTNITVWPLVCKCGRKLGVELAKPLPPKPIRMSKPTCIHRLPVVGFADCKCDGKPDVYGCSIHTYCMPRPIRNGKQLITLFKGTTELVTMNYCNKCEERS